MADSSDRDVRISIPRKKKADEPEEHVLREEFDELKKELSDLQSKFKKGVKSPLKNTLSRIIEDSFYFVSLCTVIGGLGLGIIYGPLDTTQMLYSEIAGKPEIKHRNVVHAKSIYMRLNNRTELSSEDNLKFYREIGLVPEPGKIMDEKDISWYKLFKYIDTNDPMK